MNIEMIRAAALRQEGHVRRTPLLNSSFVDEIAGRRVWMKAEALQHTGSFKFRGGWSAISALSPQAKEAGVIAFSSGNHAQGVALAARMHGATAVIIMPSNAPKLKVDNTRALGAEVILYDRDTEDRQEIGLSLSQARGLTLIQPYDEPEVIAGQGSCGLEIAEQLAEVGITAADVLVCCGGGGLTSGIALALEADAPGMRVRPVEPIDFDDVTRSLLTGIRQTNSKLGGSICDAIVTPTPGTLTFPIMKRLCGKGIVMSEVDCLRAMSVAFSRFKVVLEPGGAIALAAALYHSDRLSGEDVVCIASGGNVDAEMFARALADHPCT
jgi:threonine dehydratase